MFQEDMRVLGWLSLGLAAVALAGAAVVAVSGVVQLGSSRSAQLGEGLLLAGFLIAVLAAILGVAGALLLRRAPRAPVRVASPAA